MLIVTNIAFIGCAVGMYVGNGSKRQYANLQVDDENVQGNEMTAFDTVPIGPPSPSLNTAQYPFRLSPLAKMDPDSFQRQWGACKLATKVSEHRFSPKATAGSWHTDLIDRLGQVHIKNLAHDFENGEADHKAFFYGEAEDIGGFFLVQVKTVAGMSGEQVISAQVKATTAETRVHTARFDSMLATRFELL